VLPLKDWLTLPVFTHVTCTWTGVPAESVAEVIVNVSMNPTVGTTKPSDAGQKYASLKTPAGPVFAAQVAATCNTP
jgi:hypothetical protein